MIIVYHHLLTELQPTLLNHDMVKLASNLLFHKVVSLLFNTNDSILIQI